VDRTAELGMRHADGTPFVMGPTRTAAANAAWAAVGEATFETYVFLGELRETMMFLASPVNRIRDWLYGVKRRNAREISRAGSFYSWLSDNWLGYRYGIRPLVADFHSAMEAIAKLSEEVPERHTARGYASSTLAWNDTRILPNAGNWTAARDRNFSGKTECRAGVLYEIDHTNIFGLTFRSLPLAAWELIPFSFVFDWFIDVGDFIGAMTPKHGVNVLGSWLTTRDEVEVWSDTYFTGRLDNNTFIDGGSLQGISLYEGKRREATLQGPLFDITPDLQGWDLGTGRVLDSLALIYQLVRSR
jgi:hypothetical protein